MTLPDYKILAEIIQSGALVLGVLIGAAWAVYQFIVLKSVPKARAEVEKARAELEKTLGEVESIKRALKSRPILNLDISTESIASAWLKVTVVVTNSGSRTEMLDWTAAEVFALKVEAGAESPVLTGSRLVPLSLTALGVVSSGIAPGERLLYTFLFSLPSPGTYMVYFAIPSSAHHRIATIEEAREAAVPVGDATQWSVATFTTLGPEPPTNGAT